MVFALAAIGCSGVSKAPTPLAWHGQARYLIVLSASASPSQQRGGHELQTYLSQITGANFLLVQSDTIVLPDHAILVGYSKYTDALAVPRDSNLGPDGFVIKTVGPHIVIAGSPIRGTMYGCTAFLEQLGVRWFTASVTCVPHNPDLQIPLMNIRETPAFEYREPYFAEAWDKDWAARNRVIGHSPHLDASTGGKIAYADFCHSFDRLIPPDLYKTHPEYFPLIDGKRKSGYVQRCLTNPDVLKLAIAGVKQAFKDHPECIITTVSQNDCNEWCTCENCMRLANQYGGQSGLYVWFVNQVAQGIEKDYPDHLVDTLAYMFTEQPPANIKPRANVRIRLCPIKCCQVHPYETDSYENNAAFVKRLKGWSAITDTLYIWHYNTNFAHYLAPFPDFGQFPSSIRLYKNNGVKGVFFEGAYAGIGGGSDAELRSYVMARLLWSPNQDENALINDYLNGVFGPAAPQMRAYFDLMQSTIKPPQNHLRCYNEPKQNVFTPAFMNQAAELFDQAEKLPLTDQQKTYLKKERLGIRYLDLFFHPRVGKDLDAFLTDVRSLHITHVSEAKSFDDWEKEYRAKNVPKA